MEKKRFIALVVAVAVVTLGAVALGLSTINQPEPTSNENQKDVDNSNMSLNTPDPENGDTDEEPKVTTADIDMLEWLTYRNEDLGFEIKHPINWQVKDSDSKMTVYSDDYKMGLAVNIERSDKTLRDQVTILI